MEKKINIAELLKDCPKGMELYSTLYENLVFCRIDTEEDFYPIVTQLPNGVEKWFTPHGTYDLNPNAKCVIFPKGRTTWEGFKPPCKFKDGDIIFTHINSSKCNLDSCWISIFKEYRYNKCACYCCVCLSDLDFYHDKWEDELLCELCEIEENRLASEEEKDKLFRAIKEHGYKWDAETKTLEKIKGRKFDIKTCLNCKTFKDMHQNCPYSPIWRYKDLNEAKSHLRDETDCQFWNEIPETKTIEPKFKIGDRIKNSDNCHSSIVAEIKDDCFIIKTLDGFHHSYLTDKLPFSKQAEYELVTDKFDINTLKPFDKVLVRGDVGQRWIIDFFGFMDNKKGCPFVCVGHYVTQCIPYEGNEHLLRSTDECDEYYKNWK